MNNIVALFNTSTDPLSVIQNIEQQVGSENVKFKSHDNQVVINSPEYFYKIYMKNSQLDAFTKLVRQALGEIYEEEYDLHWKVLERTDDNVTLQIEEREKVEPVRSFLKMGVPRSIKQLKNLYKDNVKFQKRLNELKFNRTIAFKDDFDLLEYQSTLVKLLSKRISLKNLHDLQKKFIIFNEKNFGFVGPKGRFTNMAEKIKYNIPFYLYEKIRKLDTDKIISRYNYYKKVNERISNNIRKKYELKKKKKKNEKSQDSGDNSFGVQLDSLSN